MSLLIRLADFYDVNFDYLIGRTNVRARLPRSVDERSQRSENMTDKRVRAIDDIVFENTTPPITLLKGTVYGVEEVRETGIILYTDDGGRFMIDLDTFEAGFEAV